jgi:uncharacterized protein (TIGR02246 family)
MRVRFAPLLLALAACARAVDTSADAAAVAALRDSIMAAENGGRADGMLAAFAEDVVVMPPNAPALDGKTAATEMIRGGFAAMTMTVQYTSAEVVVAGDWAFDRGSYNGSMAPRAGGPAVPDRGKYLWVLHRQADGTWKYHRVTWNADSAAAN